jgi:hypothetical protein
VESADKIEGLQRMVDDLRQNHLALQEEWEASGGQLTSDLYQQLMAAEQGLMEEARQLNGFSHDAAVGSEHMGAIMQGIPCRIYVSHFQKNLLRHLRRFNHLIPTNWEGVGGPPPSFTQWGGREDGGRESVERRKDISIHHTHTHTHTVRRRLWQHYQADRLCVEEDKRVMKMALHCKHEYRHQQGERGGWEGERRMRT